MNLVIVESPTKAKTISKFLNRDFQVKSSFGHVRDLPEYKMGVDIAHDFAPHYVVPRKSQKIVNELKKTAQKAKYIYFATDEDREGEAIAWHLAQILKPKPEQIKRIAFHEITREAIIEALKHPRDIDNNLVNAQQARRILDRLVGYELSPFLWRKVAKGLSAGRVQSVAVRLIVEREREIQTFKPQEYWTIDATFLKLKIKDEKLKIIEEKPFEAKLYKINNAILDKFDIATSEKAEKIIKNLEGAEYKVADISQKEIKRHPLPPFTTSTLQQEANRRFGFSAKQTMVIAQQLYEGVELGDEGSVGLITYMRTDSVNLAEKFLNEARTFISSSFGNNYLPPTPRRFITKSKLAQEAHEAIRPTDPRRDPESVRPYLNDQQHKLYDLIWRRAIASQMAEAVLINTAVNIEAIPSRHSEHTTRVKESRAQQRPPEISQSPHNSFKITDTNIYTFRTTGLAIKFDGFLKIYGTSQETILPPLEVGEPLELVKLIPNQHFTEPPPRYSDASLVKALEEYGIGRPSTYAPTISTIIERGYVERIEGRRLKPKEIAFLVNDLLVQHFPKIVDYKFTAQMEDNLDEIAQGKKDWISVLRAFYVPFKENLKQKYQEISKKELIEEKTKEICEKCGAPMVIKTGRYGKFLACSAFPKCQNIKSLEKKEKNKLTEETCDKCGAPMVIKSSRYGKFLSCSRYPNCKNIKPFQKSTGVKCPKCKKGEIIEKRSKKGRTFYACDQYPKCKFVLWSRPTGEVCPKCENLLVYGKKDRIICSNNECDFKK